jgi:hypothetical protein
MIVRVALVIGALTVCAPASARAQDRGWIADVSIGWAGFVDDATKNYLLLGGSVRRFVSPRISIGPELVVMSNGDEVRDLNVLLTGNVVFDVSPASRVSPFAVGGGGIFWGRDQVNNGPYWSSDPAFTAGGGLRATVSDSIVAAIEYRIGWELHQRLSGSIGARW